jgi:hypothetical protein
MGASQGVNPIEGFSAHPRRMAFAAQTFRLQFLADEPGPDRVLLLEERHLQAAGVDDAARAAAFGGWPLGARVCRIADPDGREVGSVARFA